jgi:hypothetical protein
MRLWPVSSNQGAVLLTHRRKTEAGFLYRKRGLPEMLIIPQQLLTSTFKKEILCTSKVEKHQHLSSNITVAELLNNG